jgi:hypothetical protein
LRAAQQHQQQPSFAAAAAAAAAEALQQQQTRWQQQQPAALRANALLRLLSANARARPPSSADLTRAVAAVRAAQRG